MVYKKRKTNKRSSKNGRVNNNNSSKSSKYNKQNKRNRTRRSQVKFPNKQLTKKQRVKRDLYMDKRDYSPSLSIKTRMNDMDGPLH